MLKFHTNLALTIIGIVLISGCSSSNSGSNSSNSSDCEKGIFESDYAHCKRLCERDDSEYNCRIICMEMKNSFTEEDFKDELKSWEEACKDFTN